MKKTLLTLALFCGALAARAQNIYGSFENWHNYTAGGAALEAPQGWTGSDSLIDALGFFNSGSTAKKQVYKSTSVHGGTYAARMVTASFGGSLIDTFAGGMVNGKPSVNFTTFEISYTNLTPVTQRIGSMSVWAKYNPAAPSDTGVIILEAIKSGAGAGGKDSVIAANAIPVPAMSAYTLMNVPLNYGSNTLTPDRVLIEFASSDGGEGAEAVGSELFVDDASLNLASGITQPLFGQPVVKCFPNPTNGVIHFETGATVPLTWQAFTADGRLMANYTFTGAGAYTFGEQTGGMYLFRIVDKDGAAVQTGSFILKH